MDVLRRFEHEIPFPHAALADQRDPRYGTRCLRSGMILDLSHMGLPKHAINFAV